MNSRKTRVTRLRPENTLSIFANASVSLPPNTSPHDRINGTAPSSQPTNRARYGCMASKTPANSSRLAMIFTSLNVETSPAKVCVIFSPAPA